jgi:hypothetical protein
MARRTEHEPELDNYEDHDDELLQGSDVMTDAIRATPWWLISIVGHFVLVLVFMTIVYALPAKDVEIRVISDMEAIEEELYDPEKVRDIEEIKDPVETEFDPTDTPQITNETPDDVARDNTDEPTDEPNSDNESEYPSDTPFDSMNTNTAMGPLGGLAGGVAMTTATFKKYL